ncbi:caspase-9-like protein [Leptotrombidium deliense]|uniref:Caspase-9-like protein n=1 Tax=Leptotrombidium deliense TaxID=299467 RepID=A0A443SDG0_9ACAR|nr:caspase-9-like protein [Leptotrombidium deliense]
MESNIFCQTTENQFENQNKQRIRKGLCLFILNINYEGDMKRDGAEKDLTRITEVFTALDYDIVYLRDLQSSQFMHCLAQEISGARESDQALFIFISTHSDLKSIWTVDKGHVLLVDIYKEISDSKIPALRHIPKVLIIQGCRGDALPLRSLNSMRDILVVFNRECNDAKFDLNANTYYVTLCNKIRALNDTELFNILRKVESLLCNERRYSFRTDAIGLYKLIYLNDSSRFEFRDDCYDFKNNRKGICIVINNFSFKNTTQIDSSLRDMIFLCETFKSISYTVIPKINLNKEEIFRLFENIKRREEFENFYCVTVMILCSANKNQMNCILDNNGEAIPMEVIIEKCPKVQSQPSLIFIQAMERVN